MQDADSRLQQALTTLDDALELATDCYRAYGLAEPPLRRQFNQVFFRKLLVSDDDAVDGQLAPPFSLLLAPDLADAVVGTGALSQGQATTRRRSAPRQTKPLTGASAVRGLNMDYVVGLTGASSKQLAQLRRLAAELPALLRRRPQRAKPRKQRQTQRRLTAKQVDQLVAEYQAGDDMTVLAARWGVHRATVAGHLRRAGVALRRQGVPTERLAEAGQLYAGGWSCQRLAERYRCDAETGGCPEFRRTSVAAR